MKLFKAQSLRLLFNQHSIRENGVFSDETRLKRAKQKVRMTAWPLGNTLILMNVFGYEMAHNKIL